MIAIRPSLSRERIFDILNPVRQRLEEIEINDPKTAKLIVRLIPAQCPFAREITLFGYGVGRIPPLCKLNPLYDQLVSLRFRCLCFLADQCSEEIHSYL